MSAGSAFLPTPRLSAEEAAEASPRTSTGSTSPAYGTGADATALSPPLPARSAAAVAAAGWTSNRRATPFLVLGWIALSSTVILNNRYILIDKGFNHPITLTTIHLTFQTLATRILHRYTQLISGPVPEETAYRPVPSAEDDTELSEIGTKDEDIEGAGTPITLDQWKRRSVEMDWTTWTRRILPVALLFSLSLILSNWAYLFCSVAFIHILKSFAPVAILLAAFAFRTKSFSLSLLAIVLVISVGVGMASYGQVNFSQIGFGIQMTAIIVEAIRVTLIQLLLSPPAAPGPGEAPPPPLASALATGMSPLKSLYFFAPAGLAVNLICLVAFEGLPAMKAIPALGPFTILGNASLTFALNLSSIMLIGVSAMLMGLAKIFKDVSLVVLPVLLLGESLSGLQVIGYSVATAGLIAYKLYG